MSWRPDLRPEVVRVFDHSRLIPERDGLQTAHLVVLPEGRLLRVLPDDRHTGVKRSRVLRDALERLDIVMADSVDLIDPYGWVRHEFESAGLKWEQPDRSEVQKEAAAAVLVAIGAEQDATGHVSPPIVINQPDFDELDERALNAFSFLQTVHPEWRPLCFRVVVVGRSIYLWIIGQPLVRLEVPA